MFQIVPRMAQMQTFLEARRTGAFANSEEAFLHSFAMSREQMELLQQFGLFSAQASIESLEQLWERTKELGFEQLIAETLGKLTAAYPVGKMLHVEHFLMDEQDTFGRETLQGVSAYATYEGSICLIVWPEPKVGKMLESTVVHEYHHHWRIQALGLQEQTETLLERLVLEGLAEHFVAEVLGEVWQGPWVRVMTEQEARQLWPVYQEHLDAQGAATTPYMFGSEELGLPFWSGYALGYQLVQAYRNRHPELTIEQLTLLPAEAYWEF